MRAFLAGVLAILLCAPVAARQPQTVLINVGSSQGSGVLCGGTADNSHRVVLSVAHVTGSQPGRRCLVTVGGLQHEAVLIGADPQRDVSALAINGRHLKTIPPAKLWMGELNNSMQATSEGWVGRQFAESRGRLGYVRRASAVFSQPTTFGMSGGPTFLQPPYFISLNSQSDLQSISFGPYRTFLVKWIPTVKTTRYQLTCNSGGQINMVPRGGRIEGPIAIPEAPPEPTQSIIKQPEPEPAISNDELKAKLGAELKKLLEASKPQIVDTKPVQVQPVQQPSQPIWRDGEVITINVPVRLRVRTTEQIRVEVVE